MPRKFDPEKFYGKVFDLLDEKEDYSGALKLLETVPPAHKKKKEYHIFKAVCYYYLDKDKKALTHLNKISSKFRKDPDYQFLKAECHYDLGRDKDLDPAIQAYSNAIELYESDPKSLEWFGEEDMTSARSKILSYRALKGINELNENNLKSVQESLDYIMEHHSDCMDEDSFGPTGVFLVKCSLSDEFSDRKEDYIDLSITSLEKAIKKCEKDSQNLNLYKNVLGWAYSLSGINAIEKEDISSIKRMAEKIIGMDLTLSDEYEAYLHIGIFLVSCYNIKDLLETDEQYLLNAQTFLSECLKSDVKDIKNTSKLYLGILNIDNQDAFNDYTRGLEFDDELFNDIYIIFQTLHDLNKKPRSVIQALNNLKERKNIPEILINFYLVLAYWNAKQKNKAKKLLTKIKREDFPSAFYLLPVFDLACCVILDSSEAKVHLEEWVEQYPDSERFKEFLESAEKENLDAINGEPINILIPISCNNYSIISNDQIKELSYTIGHDSPIKLKDRSKHPDDSKTLLNTFIYARNVWEISFNGKSVSLSNTFGLKYIHYILDQPRVHISCFDIEKSLDIGDSTLINTEEIKTNTSQDGSQKKNGNGSFPPVKGYEIIDDQAEKEYKEKLKDLYDEYQTSIELSDTIRKEEIESEIDQINHQLKSGRNIHGRKREFSTDSEKCRQRVLRNYKTALKNIDKHLPELANYLKDQIVTGFYYIYKHEDSTEWTLS